MSPSLIQILSLMSTAQTYHTTSLNSIVILSSCLLLGLPSGLFPPNYPTKILYACLIACYMSRRSHHFRFDHPNNISYKLKIMTLQFAFFSSFPSLHSLWVQIFLLSTLFLNALNLCSSLNMRGHILHQYKTKGKIVVFLLITLCEINIFG
jgi:hypothetical protein